MIFPAEVSALSSLQWFDANGLVTGWASGLQNNLQRFSFEDPTKSELV